MKLKKFFLVLGFFFTLSFAVGQGGPVRIELEARADVYELIPCGEQGVMIFYESIREIDEQSKAWVFIFYDRLLQPVWSLEIPVYRDLKFQDHYLQDKNVFLAFQKTEKARRDEYNFQILEIDIANGDFKGKTMFVPDNATLVSFKVWGDRFVAGMNYDKDEAILLIRDLNTDAEASVQFTDKPTFIEDVRIDPASGEITTALTLYTSRRESELYVNTYDDEAALLSSVRIAPPYPTQKLMNAQVNFMPDNELYVLGSFNNLNGTFSRAEEDEAGEDSEGFYIAKIAQGEQEFIRFHKLLDFRNITDILNNEELIAVNKLIEKEKRKGKEQNLYYDFLIHDLKIHDDRFIMLAEAYYPKYQQVSTISYDIYGQPMPYYYNVFEGYRYFNAFLVSFDLEGNILWTNGIKIWDVLSKRLLKRTSCYIDGDNVVVFYNYDGNIVSKVIDRYQELGSVESVKLATKKTGDVQIEASLGMISHWYGNFFLAWGYQTLRNNQVGGGSKRRVFYINKLAFD